MAGFEIDDGQSTGVDENIFGAEVAQDETTAVLVGIVDESLKDGTIIGVITPEAAVIGIEAEFVEHREIAESPGEGLVTPSFAMNDGEDRSELPGNFQIGLAVEELGFPDTVIGGGGFHREEKVFAIFKEDAGDDSRFEEVGENFQDFDFVEDAGGTAEPGIGGTKLFADLFDDEVGLVVAG